MKLFGKREIVFETRDKALQLSAREILKRAGVELMEAGSYETEPPVCGCGAKLDVRDFGEGGKIQRQVYYLAVRPESADHARALLQDVGAPRPETPENDNKK
jgi:hypothetical protein